MPAIDDFIDLKAEVDASFYLRAAQAAVRRACGWHISPGIELSGSIPTTGGRIVRLPAMGVSEVIELKVFGVDALDRARWTDDGLVEFPRPLPASIGGVEYRIVAGYDVEEIPDVVDVVRQVARRAANAPAGAVKSQSVNGASVSYGFSGDGAPSVMLLASEREALAPYMMGRLP